MFWLAALNPDVEVKLLLLVGASIREPMGGPFVCWSALNCLQQYFFRHFFSYLYHYFFSSNFFRLFFWSIVVTIVDCIFLSLDSVALKTYTPPLINFTLFEILSFNLFFDSKKYSFKTIFTFVSPLNVNQIFGADATMYRKN